MHKDVSLQKGESNIVTFTHRYSAAGGKWHDYNAAYWSEFQCDTRAHSAHKIILNSRKATKPLFSFEKSIIPIIVNKQLSVQAAKMHRMFRDTDSHGFRRVNEPSFSIIFYISATGHSIRIQYFIFRLYQFFEFIENLIFSDLRDDKCKFIATATLCCWQKVTMMGRHTPGAGFLSSLMKRVLSGIGITAVYMLLFSNFKSLSGYAS